MSLFKRKKAGEEANTVTHSADCAEIPKIKAYRILLAFPGSNRRIAGDLRLTRLIGVGTHRFFSFVFYGYQKSLCDIIHRFGNGMGGLTGGERASALAAHGVTRYLLEHAQAEDIPTEMGRAALRLNEEVKNLRDPATRKSKRGRL